MTPRRFLDRSGWRVTWVNRGPNAYMGRFGGGWQWCLGIEVGRSKRTVILNLIWGYLRVERRPVQRPPGYSFTHRAP